MEKHLKMATFFATALDNSMGIGKFRFGISAFFDLIPGIGDTIDALLSFYLVWIAIKVQLPTDKILQMIGNIILSYLISIVPIFGDVVYILRKTNLRNLSIITSYRNTQTNIDKNKKSGE